MSELERIGLDPQGVATGDDCAEPTSNALLQRAALDPDMLGPEEVNELDRFHDQPGFLLPVQFDIEQDAITTEGR